MSGRELGYQHAKLVTVSGDNGMPGGTKTNFKVNLGNSMQKVARVSICSVSFPNNAWNVNSEGGGRNNYFTWFWNNVLYEGTVEGGFYTTNTLMAEIVDAINSAIHDTQPGTDFKLTQDATTQLVTASLTSTSPPQELWLQLSDNQLDNQISSPSNGLYGLLGFTDAQLSSSDIPGFLETGLHVSTSISQTAGNLPSLGGLKTVYLQSEKLAGGNMFQHEGDIKNTLLVIPITAEFGKSNVFECKVDELCEITFMTPKTQQVVDFSLTDKEGNIVDLHGGNLIINLKIWFRSY